MSLTNTQTLVDKIYKLKLDLKNYEANMKYIDHNTFLEVKKRYEEKIEQVNIKLNKALLIPVDFTFNNNDIDHLNNNLKNLFDKLNDSYNEN